MYKYIDSNLLRFLGAFERRNYPSVNNKLFRDLKPANVMTKASLFKIGDFGFSKQQ